GSPLLPGAARWHTNHIHPGTQAGPTDGGQPTLGERAFQVSGAPGSIGELLTNDLPRGFHVQQSELSSRNSPEPFLAGLPDGRQVEPVIGGGHHVDGAAEERALDNAALC